MHVHAEGNPDGYPIGTPYPPELTINGIPVRVERAYLGCALIWQYSTGGRVFLYGTTAEGMAELRGDERTTK